MNASWRVIYAIRPDAVVILDVFKKQTEATPESIKKQCAMRIRKYDEARSSRQS